MMDRQSQLCLSLPAISTDCGGAKALIEDGVDGMIAPCNDPDTLAQTIRKNLADVEGAKHLGEKTKNSCADQVVTQWEDYITEILKEKT